MKKYLIGICDDEENSRNILQRLLLEAFKQNNIDGEIVTFTDGSQVLSDNRKLDLIFLDEEMPRVSGSQVKEIFQKRGYDTAIIYVTSHEEIMGEAFGRNVYSFLTKPVSYNKLEERLLLTLSQIERTGGLMYMGTESQYVRYYMAKGDTIVKKKSLADAMEGEENYNLIRCHRSWCVNLSFVEGTRKAVSILLMSDGREIPVSRTYREAVKNAISEYKRGETKRMLGD